MYSLLRRLFRKLPDLPDSLVQDLHNPLQRDRLPDTSNIQLDFPAFSGSLEQNRRSTRRNLLVAFLIALVINSIGLTFGFFAGLTLGSNMAAKLVQFAAALGFTITALAYLSAKPWRFQRLWQWIVVPHVALALLLLDLPALAWTVTAGLALLVADRFATHYLHLQTTAPMDRARALGLRKMWDARFGLRQAVRGAELYGLSLSLPCLAVLLLLWMELRAPHQDAMTALLRFGICVVGLVVATLCIEWLAAFLYARPAIQPRRMFRYLRHAVVLWFTYNRAQLSAPGIYQTPAGTFRQRRWMSFGLVLLTAAALALLAGPRVRSERHEPPASAAATEETPVTSPAERVGEEDHLPIGQSIVLETYQEQMIESMPEERRDAYIAQLEAARTAELDAVVEPAAGSNPRSFLPDFLVDTTFTQTLRGTYVVLLFFAAPALAALLTLVFLYACIFATIGRAAGRFGPASSVSPEEVFSSDRWDQLVSRVQDSGDKTEKNSLLLGVNATDNTPILVPRSIFAEHAHLLGDSGSGKTSIGIATILSQLIRSQECSVVVLDLKGDDLALFHGVAKDAEEAGLRFRWFTNQLEQSTYAFNPLRQAPLKRMTLYQKVDMLTAAMGLQYGRDYGRAYYSDANARMLHAALEHHGDIASFEQLADILADPNALPGIDREMRQAGAHLGTIVNRLADSEPLNVIPNDGQAASVVDASIEFTDVFRQPQAIHFHLTSTIGATSSSEIARVALYSLITAATAVPPRERVQTFVVIDEFQRIVAGNIEMLLQLTRSLNIGIILANQSLMDLKTAGIDLIPAISANTRFRQIFAASNLEEQERISRGSGEALTYKQAWQEYIGTFVTAIAAGRNLSEQITPRLRMNDILLATDDPLQSIVQIRRGHGYAQYGGMPFVMRSTYPITFDEYRERKKESWPEPSEETLVSQVDRPPRAPGARPGWFGEQDVFVDQPEGASSGAHFLDQLYQQQLASSDPSAPANRSAPENPSDEQEPTHDD